jgi:hypothetical protein
MTRCLGSLLAALALLWSAPALADRDSRRDRKGGDEPDEPPHGSEKRPMADAAKEELLRGEAQVKAGDYSSAIASYEAGFAIDPHPDFLYAKGQAQRLNGDCAGAIQSYQGFLATSPSEGMVKATRYNITRCEAEIAAGRQRDAAPAPRYRPRWKDPLGGVLAGGALVGFAAGATFFVLADRDVDAANNAEYIDDYYSLRYLAEDRRRTGTYAVIAGGALAVGAVLRYALHDPPQIQLTGAVTGSGAAIAIGGTF